jgi:glycosyltransferase involved in cell wall biosynthesis
MTRVGSLRPGVIALVPDAWADLVMPRHQILRRLARRFPVVWIDPPGGWRSYWLPGGERFLRGRRWTSPEPGLTVLESGMLSPVVYRPSWLRRATFRLGLESARRHLLGRGATDVVLYLWRYEFSEAIDLCPHSLSCYHIDDEYSFSEVERPNDPRETALIRRVDQVIVHSSALMQKKAGLNPHTALVPNGVDYEAFSSARDEPADLRGLPRPRLGYVGVIKKQLDLALLARIARARPEWSIAMVGPVGNVQGKEHLIAELSTLPNVHFLGLKAVDELASYGQYLDVCLMCYELNDYTRYIYPLKLHEYLASGRPIVASAIPAIVEHSDVVTIAHGDEQWLAGVQRALEPRSSAKTAAEVRRARARQYDWDALAGHVADLINERLAARDSAIRPRAQDPSVG